MLSRVLGWFSGQQGLPLAPLNARRFAANPIVRPDMLTGGDGDNINGPSLIRVPDWAPSRLGRYYLYFAHHHGSYIRLAYAERLEGPWSIHAPGALDVADVPSCRGHIASPDVHVDEARREFRMYFHGPARDGSGQVSFAAVSRDGIHFAAREEAIANFYLRAAPWAGRWLAMAKGGVMYLSPDGLTGFERLPRPAFPMWDEKANRSGSVRHVALQLAGQRLAVYHSKIGDAPECILRSWIDLNCDPSEWRARGAELVVRPETAYEGADLPVRKSRSGAAKGREHALRDPAIFVEGGRTFLLYSVAGESGIAIAELTPI